MDKNGIAAPFLGRQAGIGKLAFAGLDSFAKSEEASEGRRAFAEKRDPDFSKFR